MVLTDRGEFSVTAAPQAADALWMSVEQIENATGWALKPEGLCRDEICVPLPLGREAEIARDGRVNAAAFWIYLKKPALRSDDGGVWVLGEGAADRAAALNSLEAPDFALPDRNGKMHRLSEQRGKKVFLVTWASW